MKVKVSELRKQVSQALKKAGYTTEEIEMITNVVMFGQLSGKLTHGIVRLFKGENCILKSTGDRFLEIKKLSNNSSKIIASNQPGMLVNHIALNESLEIASTHKISIVTTKGSESTSGCITYYLEKITQNDLIGIIMSTSPPFVAPFNSTEALFGTNPIGFGFPTSYKPLLFDMATSATTFGDVLINASLGQNLPEGIAFNKDGVPSTDPNEVINGAVKSFDNSYKGSGLAMVVEILAGVLATSSYTNLNNQDGWGNMILTFSPELFMTTTEFKSRMDEFINRIENAKTRDGEKVRLPGMHTLAQRDENLADDEIDVEDEILNEFYTYL